MTVIGAIIGFTLVVSMVSMIYILLSTIKPYKTITNYLKIIQVVMLIFIFDTILPNDLLVHKTLILVIFGSIGLIIILTNLICYIKSKSLNVEELKKNWEKSINKEHVFLTDETEGVFLFHLVAVALTGLLFVNFESNSIGDNSILVLLNGFILFKYLKSTKHSRSKIYIYSGISFLLVIIAIVLRIVTKDIIGTHTFIQAFIFVLPSIYLFPSILKNYYHIIWNQFYEANYTD